MIKKSILLTSLILSLGACSQSESDKVADAQACLDNSTPATAMECVDKVEGVNSKEASLIRCSAAFIYEGLASASELSRAMEQITNSGNSSVGMMDVLKFDKGADADANDAFVGATFNHCEAAGNPGFVLVASFSRMATTIARYTTLDGSFNPASIATAGNEVIGATALAAYQVSCQAGAESNQELCSQLSSAIDGAGGDPETIGSNLTAIWNTP